MSHFYFVFSLRDAVYYTIAHFLKNAQEILHKNNIGYYPQSIPYQLWNNEEFIYQIKAYLSTPDSATDLRRALRDKIKICLTPFAAASPTEHLLYTSSIPSLEALDYLLQEFSQIPHMAKRKKHAIFLLGRQDGELRTQLFSTWRTLSASQLFSFMLTVRGWEHLDTIYDRLSSFFGASHCHFLTYQTSHPWKAPSGILNQLCSLLGVSVSEDIQRLQPGYPRTFPGLDMLFATYEFPFTFKGRVAWDKNGFYNTLRHVEKNEGYPLAEVMPQPEASKILQACEAGNVRLARILGHNSLFTSPHPLDALPPLPAELPEITTVQCRTFVSALEPNFRTALLRFFRGKDTLHPIEYILAHQLEDFRKRLFSTNTFNWPRKSAPVSVLTLCWNQERYITECMESVAEQYCEVPVDHIIVDDCSDDASASLIDDFASRHAHVHPIYLKERAGHGENVRELFSHCKSHYAALCDADDYFTDPCKLQKQLNFLQQHKNCALCFHPVRLVYEDGSPSRLYPSEDMLPGGQKEFYTLKDLLTANIIQTNSVIYRWRFREGLPAWFDPTLIPGDWYWHLLHAELGAIGYQPDVMSAYRRHGTSFFAASEHDHVQHRALYGLHELRLYAAVERHFKGKFHNQLSRLATGVLSDFVMLYLKSGDDALLKQGVTICPEFGKDFLQKLHQ